jgi:methylisocitrate lyase
MVDRIKAAVDAKTDPDFFVVARTDALASEGFERMLDRAMACVEAGADGLFPEAITDLEMYARVCKAVKVPVLANITEFGKTPLFALEELRGVGIGIALYPLSAFRAANLAALKVYEDLRSHGTQKASVPAMQTREDLYNYLGYHDYERKLDALFAKGK